VQEGVILFISFLNPQGNFDPGDRYWTEHPDFGGQLVYVKEVAIAMATLGHQVDILTRQIRDPEWPEFSGPEDHYPGVSGVRILRIPCGPAHFLPKEQLWPYLGTEWVPNLIRHYRREGGIPDAFTTHYADGGLSGALVARDTGKPFTFTGHSLGAQKMDKLGVTRENLQNMDERYHFTRRILAERVSMNHAGRIITSTTQERLEQYAHPAYMGAIDPSSENQFAVIPPGVNLDVFSPESAAEDPSVQTRLGSAIQRDIADGRREFPIVVCSSRFDPKKNHIGLVKAFTESPELQAIANLAIVTRGLDDPLRRYDTLGEGERAIMDEIVGLINEHNLWGKVTSFSLNSQAELAAAYRHLTEKRSVFALTALYEPFGLAPLEAMSCGLPAVVTENGGPSESLREGNQEYGVLVDPTDPADIAHGLLRVLESDKAWEQFHRLGMQRVLDRYTWDRTAEGYLEVIQGLVSGPAPEGELAIPPYFTDPRPETEIPPSALARLYFA
jgi:sucrose-phosphate synthase